MICKCAKCGLKIALDRRTETCPYCEQETTWEELLNEMDRRLLRSMKISPQ